MAILHIRVSTGLFTLVLSFLLQERLKEQMKIMGLSNGVHWLAWYTTSLLLITPSIVLLLIIFKYGKVLMFANSAILALLLAGFSFATATQGKC